MECTNCETNVVRKKTKLSWKQLESRVLRETMLTFRRVVDVGMQFSPYAHTPRDLLSGGSRRVRLSCGREGLLNGRIPMEATQ